ncbi:N-acetylglucosaminyldiphosphoundecaprenol N-acetyl-beta-D-mannosaminyltransferase [Peptoniphilus ivorii]|uniref:WecB/TagA/CpsF family glycosyltransferase n=1 Tax=Aedoeadaptatus ivorii TaxID=54006 RepID=UPI002789B92B|nr:WecB/TagA/CpsF family glycosyltransferase [Peptoniphilus ivorii]MDQ0508122.1 N-acetylglucosaminyldiphosphoundecaprenol N-acetyl-beta-D-mannosaminyltransferase [Peptoniphilus ivorii]
MSSISWKQRDKIRIFNTVVDDIRNEERVEILAEMLEEDRFHRIFTPNTEIVMACRKDPVFAEAMNDSDLIVADGIGLVIGSKMRGYPLSERVTGYDLSIDLLDLAQRTGKKVFFLGGREGIAETARKNVQDRWGDIVAGVHHGYFQGKHNCGVETEEEREILREIDNSGAEILFVGLGFPKQESFILENQDALSKVRIAIGNGGVLDVLAGEAKRAPAWFIRYNLEWLYRLMKNPSRLSRQLAIPAFLWRIRRDKDAVARVASEKGGNDAE